MKKKPTSLRRSMFMRLGFNFYDVAVTIFCVAFGLLCFYPLWYCLVASVMPYEEYVKGGLMLWFKGIDLQYYIQIFSTKVYTNSLLVSAVKTVLATALSVLVTSAMAYAVSKVHIRGISGAAAPKCAPETLPCRAAASMTCRKAACMAGWAYWPRMPKSCDISFGPIIAPSIPSTAMMASMLDTPSWDSIWQSRTVSRLALCI